VSCHEGGGGLGLGVYARSSQNGAASSVAAHGTGGIVVGGYSRAFSTASTRRVSQRGAAIHPELKDKRTLRKRGECIARDPLRTRSADRGYLQHFHSTIVKPPWKIASA
jgi:hypothetical protein